MNLQSLGTYQERFLQLVDKAGEIRPFSPNIYQKKLNDLADKNRRKPWRILVLKCRQIGATTWGSSYIYHRTATQFHKNALIIADSDENSSGIFDKCKNYYSWSPEIIRPMKRFSNEKALVFNNPDQTKADGLDSKISISTAGNTAAGRSKTIQYLHASEMAFWSNAGQLMTGLMQSVPLLPNTAVIIESTANGINGKGAEFYNRCMRALDGDTSFDFVFFDWKDNPEYEMEPGLDFKLTDFEKELLRNPKYNLRKIAFRRYKIKNEMGSALVAPEDQWNQEYPDSPEMAFISSGRPVFSPEMIHPLLSKARQSQSIKGRFDGVGFVEDERGSLVVYQKPQSGKAYVIGADVSEGLETGDASTAAVLDENFNLVATYYSRLDPDKFGAFLVSLGKWYNNALLAPEVNNHGHATLAAIKNLNYNFIYRREVKEELGKDITDKVGWQTNTKTKALLLDELVAAVRDDSINIPCEATLREMLTLTIEDDGNVITNSKDRTMALGIAIQARKQIRAVTHRAFIPNAKPTRDVTKMTLQEKLKYYERLRRV